MKSLIYNIDFQLFIKKRLPIVSKGDVRLVGLVRLPDLIFAKIGERNGYRIAVPPPDLVRTKQPLIRD